VRLPEYRVHLMDCDHGVASVHIIFCNDDESAIVAARPFAHGCQVSIWDGARKVARLKPVGE
jgi:hypothetical protein